jgi:hypothetical protein
VRQLQHGSDIHFVIEQSDGMRTLLPAWMTEPWAADVAMIEMPRLPLESLNALRSVIINNSAILSLSPSNMTRGGVG